VYLVVGGLAAAENVFPPVPADTVVAVGAFLSRFTSLSAGAILAVTWVANVGSACVVYVAARTVGRGFFKGRIERLYARHGTWGIFVSRFLPVVRAVVPPFAGVAKLGAARTLIPVAVASGIWYGAVTIVVVLVADHLGDVARLLAGVGLVAWILALGLVVIVTVLVVVRRQRKARDQNGSRWDSVAARSDRASPVAVPPRSGPIGPPEGLMNRAPDPTDMNRE
jgi:membrane protein DedA with SNARE-associated domain